MIPATATTTAFVDGQPIEYRLTGGPGPAVLLLHGAHMSANCRFGESRILPTGAAVLVPSRPGYGRTAVSAGPSAPEFASRLAGLCRRLDLSSVVVVGISMGARSALTLAAHHPRLVERVVLLCPVSFHPWPDPRTAWLAHVMFNPVLQRGLWAGLHGLLRNRPDVILPALVRGLTTLKPQEALRRMGGDLDELVSFLATCSSGRGFVTDLRPPTDVTAEVWQPTLILASGTDGSVDPSHPESLARSLPDARLVDVEAATHLLWLGDRAGTLAREVRGFLV